MKLTTKISLIMSILIAILFSIGGTIMIYVNFQSNLDSTISRIKEQYNIECQLLYNSQDKNPIYTLQAISSISHRDYALYSSSNLLSSSIDHDTLNQIIEHFNVDDKTSLYHTFYKINNRQHLFISSFITLNNQQYQLVFAYDVHNVFDQRQEQLKIFYCVDFTVIIIGIIISYILARLITKPILKLKQTSVDMKQGQLDVRCEIENQDEIGELAESFNSMADVIEKQIEELQRTNQAKDDFIASFTHELKTPMTAIIGYSDMLQKEMLQDEDKKEAYQFIFHEAKRLENLSHKLLDLMALSSSIELQSYSIQELMKPIEDYWRKEHSNVSLDIELEECHVFVEASLFDCLMQNLLNNALKAKPKDLRIQIKGTKLTDHYQLQVIDTGMGMSEEHLQRITEPFYMIDKSRSRECGGSGLGLSICDKIVHLFHSRLNFESEVNVGTTVSFILEVHNEKN